MNKIKKYVKWIVAHIISIVIYIILLTIFAFTDIFSLKTIVIINYIALSIISLIHGILKGKKASKKGFIEGLKYGFILILILFILNLIFYRQFNLYIFLYYIILIASSTIGSMIGINLKH